MKIDDAVRATGTVEDEFKTVEETLAQESDVVEVMPEEPGFSLNLAWLRTPTGEGSIDDYIDHPLNFMKSRGFAQILRGATGFFGNLKLAVIDIVLGAFQFAKEKQAVKNMPGGSNGTV